VVDVVATAITVRLQEAYAKDAEGTVMSLFLTLQRSVVDAVVTATIVRLQAAYAKDAKDPDGF
jgi:hypothetical protein